MYDIPMSIFHHHRADWPVYCSLQAARCYVLAGINRQMPPMVALRTAWQQYRHACVIL